MKKSLKGQTIKNEAPVSNEIAPQQPRAIAQPQGRGFECPVDKSDIIISRAKLFQGLPAEYEQYPNAKPGQVIDSVTSEVLPVEFVPLFFTTNWIRFNPRDKKDENFDPNFEPGEVIWQSADPYDDKVIAEGEWGDDGTPPLATKFMNFFSYFKDQPMPIAISFSKTSYKSGKILLNTAMRFGGDLFGRKYQLATKKMTNDQGSYYIFTTQPIGKVEGDELALCTAMWEKFHSKPVTIHEGDTAGGESESV